VDHKTPLGNAVLTDWAAPKFAIVVVAIANRSHVL